MKLYRVFTLLAIALLSADLHSRSYITHETVIEDTASTTSSGRLVIHLNPDPHDPILASTVQITTADGLMVTEQQFSEKPQIKDGQELYTHPFSVSYKLTAPKIDLISESVVTLRFTTATDKKNRVHELALNDNYKFTAPVDSMHESGVYFPMVETAVDTELAPAACEPQQKKRSWSESLSFFILHTDSLLVRLALVLLLGLLMSLTPCIYPMIPITAGILQSQGGASFGRNVALSAAYTCGIAITFAVLGLGAAYTGQMFGSLLSNPLVIGAIVLFIGYLALSMMGLYEMYIPKFMQPRHQQVKQGSLISAFIFGAASGTFASPCLSPGLLLLLTLVTSLQNAFLGFLLLFTFGVGLSIPLLLVGSFSSSINMLPRAGMWMVEVKKLFGVVMLFMCLYFLAYILPLSYVWASACVLMLLLTALFVFDVKSYDSRRTRIYKYGFAALCLLGAGVAAHTTYQQTVCPVEFHSSLLWHTDLSCALEQAQQENKLILIDIGAPFCSICKAIDKKLFEHPLVIPVLKQFVLLKLDGSDAVNAQFTQKHQVKGFPTVILTNAAGTTELKRWGGELYTTCPEDFIAQITSA